MDSSQNWINTVRLFKSQEIQQAKLDRVIVSMGSTTESYHVGVQLWARAIIASMFLMITWLSHAALDIIFTIGTHSPTSWPSACPDNPGMLPRP